MKREIIGERKYVLPAHNKQNGKIAIKTYLYPYNELCFEANIMAPYADGDMFGIVSREA